jgi:hypothetical protein
MPNTPQSHTISSSIVVRVFTVFAHDKQTNDLRHVSFDVTALVVPVRGFETITIMHACRKVRAEHFCCVDPCTHGMA